MKLLWADGGYRADLIAWVKRTCDWTLAIVEKLGKRTFAWLTRDRRLGKDYERLPATSEAFIYVAAIRLMLKHVAHTG